MLDVFLTSVQAVDMVALASGSERRLTPLEDRHAFMRRSPSTPTTCRDRDAVRAGVGRACLRPSPLLPSRALSAPLGLAPVDAARSRCYPALVLDHASLAAHPATLDSVNAASAMSAGQK